MSCRLGTGGENSELRSSLLQKRKTRENHEPSHFKSCQKYRWNGSNSSCICCLYSLIQSQLKAIKTNFQGAYRADFEKSYYTYYKIPAQKDEAASFALNTKLSTLPCTNLSYLGYLHLGLDNISKRKCVMIRILSQQIMTKTALVPPRSFPTHMKQTVYYLARLGFLLFFQMMLFFT